jgi:hypothetical protein
MAKATHQPTNISTTPQTLGEASKPARDPIALDLPHDEAMALAQLTKRLSRADCERLSSRHDAGEERDTMIAAVDNLRAALAAAGYRPR